MKNIFLKLVVDENGQDLIEYALMAGFVAAAWGAVFPGVSEMLGTTKISSPMVIRIIFAALAAVFIGVIVLRRHLIDDEG